MFTCKVCNRQFESEIYKATEVRFGLGHKFDYIHCPHCNCVQIKDIPENLSDYYSSDYYSLQERAESDNNGFIRRTMRKYLLRYRMDGRNVVGKLMTKLDKGAFEWIVPNMMSFSSSVLDIGCGTGRTILKLAQSGVTNVSGIDPYISKDITYNLPHNRQVVIRKKAIEELTGQYDIITLNHVMEHLSEPHRALEAISKVMHKDSTLVMALPIMSNFAWSHYGIEAHQFTDAPRHLFIYSIDSLTQLASQHGLQLVRQQPYFYPKILFDVYGNMSENIKNMDKELLIKQLLETNDTGHAYVYFKTKG